MDLDTQILILRIALTALLYCFLIAVTLIAWRELRASQLSVSKTKPTISANNKRTLEVVASDNGAWHVGDQTDLLPITSFGRELANTIVVADPSVSAQHALISTRDGHLWLEDLESTNGTFVNEARVEAPMIITEGDTIRIGHVKFKLS